MKRLAVFAGSLVLAACTVNAYQVSIGTYVSNAGKTVTVPVALDSAAGLSYASATLTYDPQVLVVTKTEAGTLRSLMAEDFVVTGTNGTLTVSIFGSIDANVASGSGTIANVTFAVRGGTEGLYSDIAVAEVELGEKSGVKDVGAGNPITTVNGMVRVVGAHAAVARLDAAQVICSDTAVGTLMLKDGDAIQASDTRTAITVAGFVSSEADRIPVKAPDGGWSGGRYAILSTTTAGLSFALDGMEGSMSSEEENGVTTYYATLAQAANAWVVEPSIAGWTYGQPPSEPNIGEAKFGEVVVSYYDAAGGGQGDSLPAEPGEYVAVFSVEETENWSGLTKEVAFKITAAEEEKSYRITLTPNSTTRGSVSGGGEYMVGATATLKATAKTGNAFAGWFTDKACAKALNPEGYDNRSPTVKVVVQENDTTIYAKFVSKGDDKAALKFTSATKKLATTPANATAGSKISLKIGVLSLSLPTFSATGLPKGLSINKATGEISGVGTVPGAYTAKVTVTSAAGNKITQNVKITVNAPSWAKGDFYGTAKPGKKGDPTAYLQFTVAKTGKVSGKVNYKGKAYSFTSTYKSCTASKATFAPKVKIGKKTFKPGTVTAKTRKIGGQSLVEAANSKGTFAAQKKPELVKKGKALAKLVGKTFKFTKKTKNSGLTKSKDKLEVKLANGDAAKVTGVVGGKKLTALSWVTLVSGKATKGGSEVYTLYVDIIDAKLKYERTLVITATVGSGSVKATAAFAK